ncbi:polyprenyl synthetase family protein [Rhodobacteraceae bacterium CCMM004]|nr:polyprenyl synthetase family protein [Rhodobacteraceae bacterium CCMM004]
MPVHAAMRHAVSGGKRLRGFLVIEGAALFELAPERAATAAAAIEALHAYSLVHDDLPCMDDDDLRRGQPTVHVRWDEATAVLAGDALQSLAFELLADPSCHPDPGVRADLTLRLARAAGAQGMVLGQALDIAAETAETPLDLDGIAALQAGKTGALIAWSGAAGALLASADPAPLELYARRLGLAFQIADDLMDAQGDEARAGKRLRKDAAAGKATFVSLLGAEGARARADALVTEAQAALDGYGARAGTLRDLAAYVVRRDA